MKKLFFLLLATASLFLHSCAGLKSPLKNAKLSSASHCDTIRYNPNGKMIALPVLVNGVKKRMVLDTGADVNCIPEDSTIAGKPIHVSDSNDQTSASRFSDQVTYTIGKTEYSGSGTILTQLPEVFYCIGDAVLGNTVLKSTNYLIEKGQVVFSDQSFERASADLTLDIFYSRSNRMRANLNINGVRVDTCLIDYGGMFELELPMNYYLQYKDSFPYHTVFVQVNASSFGISGKTSTADTTINLNADIVVNGFKMHYVNISFSDVNEPRIGYALMKRFEQVAVNNRINKMTCAAYHSDGSQTRPYYSFDLKDGAFVIDAIPLDVPGQPLIKMNQIFTEINSKPAASFRTYCEFIDWKLNVVKMPVIEFKGINGITIPARMHP